MMVPIFCHKPKYCQNLGHHLMLEWTRTLVKVQYDQLWRIKILCTMAPLVEGASSPLLSSLSNGSDVSISESWIHNTGSFTRQLRLKCEAPCEFSSLLFVRRSHTRVMSQNQPKLTQRKISLVIYIQNNMRSKYKGDVDDGHITFIYYTIWSWEPNKKKLFNIFSILFLLRQVLYQVIVKVWFSEII
jgi:hypothetical protein